MRAWARSRLRAHDKRKAKPPRTSAARPSLLRVIDGTRLYCGCSGALGKRDLDMSSELRIGCFDHREPNDPTERGAETRARQGARRLTRHRHRGTVLRGLLSIDAERDQPLRRLVCHIQQDGLADKVTTPEADDAVERHVERVRHVLEVVVADEDQTRLDAEGLARRW